jgi:hypothetical protein
MARATISRWLWFLGLWATGVVAVGAVAMLLKTVMKAL